MDKIIVIGLAIVLVVIMVVVGINNAFKPTFVEADYTTETYYIQSGDSLHGIYYDLVAAGKVDANCSIDEYTEAVKDLNNMKNSNIYAGEKIKVYILK